MADLLKSTTNPRHKQVLLDQLTLMETKLRSTQALIREKKINKFLKPHESIETRIENQDCPKDKGKN
jgi:hypothetical protein